MLYSIILMKVCDHMTKFCNICHTPIDDENRIVMDNSYHFFHRHCYHFTMENYCEILEMCSFKNVKEKYSFLFNAPQKTLEKPKGYARNVINKFNQRKSS